MRSPIILVGLVLGGALPAYVASDSAAARGLVAAGELEHARANARAGGPTNERDAELLERWGCLSGTRSAFCRRLSERDVVVTRKSRRRDRGRD